MRLALGLIFMMAAFGQRVSQPSRAITSGTSDPVTCNPAQAVPFFRNTMSGLSKFCSATNTWSAFGTGSATGTVTSVSFTGGLISVANPTTTPAFTVAGTSGGIPYFSAASTWGSSAAWTANTLMKGGGAGVAPVVTGISVDSSNNITTAGTLNKVAVTAPASGATLTLADGSTLVTSGANSITLTTTGATNVTFPTSGTLATTASTDFVKGAAALTTTGAIPFQSGTTGTVTQNSSLTFASSILSVPTIVSTTTFRGTSVAFASLATGFPNNGDSGYSADSGPTSGSDDTCVSGSGAWVIRIGGAYHCNN